MTSFFAFMGSAAGRVTRIAAGVVLIVVGAVLAAVVGFVAGLVAWRYPRIARRPATPTLDTARKVGATLGKHPALHAFLNARGNPAAATGLALSLAMALAIGGCSQCSPIWSEQTPT